MMAAAEPQIGQQPEPQPAPGSEPRATSGEPRAAGTAPETVSREEHQRELDRYRNQVGAEKKKAEEALARLAEIEEAGKSEQERIAARAAEYDALLPRYKAATKLLKEQVETMRSQLSEPLQALIPEGEPLEQFAAAQKLLAAQAQMVPQSRETLPPSGGRNPLPGGPGTDDKRAFEEAAELFPTLQRLVPARRGP